MTLKSETFRLAMLMILLTISLVSVSAEEGQRQPPSNPGTNPSERWVWVEVQAGRDADLKTYCAVHPPDSDSCRKISMAFVRQILLLEPWRSNLTYRGVRIFGARFSEPFDISNAHIAATVLL